MQRLTFSFEQAIALGFLVLGGATVVGALGLTYTTEFGPGPGFFPLWLGIGMMALSLLVIRSSSVPSEVGAEDSPGTSWGKPLRLTAGLAAMAALLPFLGLLLTISLFVAWMFHRLERLSLLKSILVGAATAFAVYLVFEVWLGVPPLVGLLGI